MRKSKHIERKKQIERIGQTRLMEHIRLTRQTKQAEQTKQTKQRKQREQIEQIEQT